MLGKGLESLIPPGGGQKPNDGGSSQSQDAGLTGQAPILEFRKPEGSISSKFSTGQAQPHFREKDGAGQARIVETRKPEGSTSSKFSTEQAQPHLVDKSGAGQPRLREHASAGEAIFQIEVSKIKPNPHQPRKDFDEESIKELAASISEVGILQPLVVTKVEKETPTGTDVEYILIAGERRLLASKRLGLERVPAIIKKLDFERERLEMAIVENLQREDLNPIETARAFSRLQDEFNLTQREIATRLGKSREAVANTVRLLDLPVFIQEALARIQITETHGRLLLAVADPAAQRKLFDDILLKRMTTRELKERVKPQKGNSGILTGNDLPPELQSLQEELVSKLGAPVRIQQQGKTGKITISFFSEEELRSIVEKLGN
ncbi:MAG: ParB/RepB/Spo0J family partition protein [Candidatus Liptonbacteria bacterium]|nr:ParB/RepB/Spo0J family partition protein [Candidatus Liptonbacteria bacterium]